MEKELGASDNSDRADVNGAGQAVSAVPASVPSAGWLGFNINHKVRIRLTVQGINHLRARHDELNLITKSRLGPFRLPHIDPDGWTEMQLWQVFSQLGEAMLMGTDLPFETVIQLDAKAIEAGTVETERLDPQDESAVGAADLPKDGRA